jgi:hypothetical protein
VSGKEAGGALFDSSIRWHLLLSAVGSGIVAAGALYVVVVGPGVGNRLAALGIGLLSAAFMVFWWTGFRRRPPD